MYPVAIGAGLLLLGGGAVAINQSLKTTEAPTTMTPTTMMPTTTTPTTTTPTTTTPTTTTPTTTTPTTTTPTRIAPTRRPANDSDMNVIIDDSSIKQIKFYLYRIFLQIMSEVCYKELDNFTNVIASLSFENVGRILYSQYLINSLDNPIQFSVSEILEKIEVTMINQYNQDQEGRKIENENFSNFIERQIEIIYKEHVPIIFDNVEVLLSENFSFLPTRVGITEYNFSVMRNFIIKEIKNTCAYIQEMNEIQDPVELNNVLNKSKNHSKNVLFFQKLLGTILNQIFCKNEEYIKNYLRDIVMNKIVEEKNIQITVNPVIIRLLIFLSDDDETIIKEGERSSNSISNLLILIVKYNFKKLLKEIDKDDRLRNIPEVYKLMILLQDIIISNIQENIDKIIDYHVDETSMSSKLTLKKSATLHMLYNMFDYACGIIPQFVFDPIPNDDTYHIYFN